MLHILQVDQSTEFRDLLRIASNKVSIAPKNYTALDFDDYSHVRKQGIKIHHNKHFLSGNYKKPCNA